MKRKRMILLLTGMIALIFWGVIWQLPDPPFFPYEEERIGICIVESDDVLTGKEKMSCRENPGVLFENSLLPYDRDTNTLYLPQSLAEDEWVGRLSAGMREQSAEKFYLYAPEDQMWDNKCAAIRENYSYDLWLVSEQFYYEFQLVITGTPVISIQTERWEQPEFPTYEEDPDTLFFGTEPLYYGDMLVLDPDMSGDHYVITETGVCYHQKGATSSTVEKKSYSLDLLDAREKKNNVSLLGMRADNSWKLNSLYIDINRIREMTAAQIWENFNATNTEVDETGPRMEYVELILDNQYQGLYGLVEPVDSKKLQLGKHDVLYKIIGWDIPEDGDIQASVDMRWKIQNPIRIRYPKEITDYGVAWAPIRTYMQFFYTYGKLDYEAASESVYLDNVIDYSLFLMAVSASDNSFKNTYLACYYRDGHYVMLHVPWDLDLTFGNIYRYTPFPVEFNPDVTEVYMGEALLRLYYAAPQEVGPRIWERWTECRETFLSEEAVRQLFDENANYLIETGGAVRELERWPSSDMSMDLDYLYEYQSERLAWLDTYFYELVN